MNCNNVFLNSCFKDENGQYVMSQCDEMLRLLDEFEQRITSEWGAKVTASIPGLLNLHLMRRTDNLLEENFSDDVNILVSASDNGL